MTSAQRAPRLRAVRARWTTHDLARPGVITMPKATTHIPRAIRVALRAALQAGAPTATAVTGVPGQRIPHAVTGGAMIADATTTIVLGDQAEAIQAHPIHAASGVCAMGGHPRVMRVGGNRAAHAQASEPVPSLTPMDVCAAQRNLADAADSGAMKRSPLGVRRADYPPVILGRAALDSSRRSKKRKKKAHPPQV